jgi:Cu-processing system ATP-binding protein
VIEVTNLEKHYDNVAALRGISLEISPGTSVLVSGSNGAGKSTLLRILAGLTRPTRGRVAIHGNDPFGKHAVSYRGRVGFVGQELALYGDLTIEENLRFCARIHGLDSRPGSEPFDPLIELGLTGATPQRRAACQNSSRPSETGVIPCSPQRMPCQITPTSSIE